MADSFIVLLRDWENTERTYQLFPPAELPLWIADRLGSNDNIRSFTAQCRVLSIILDKAHSGHKGTAIWSGDRYEYTQAKENIREALFGLYPLAENARVIVRGLMTMIGYAKRMRRPDKTSKIYKAVAPNVFGEPKEGVNEVTYRRLEKCMQKRYLKLKSDPILAARRIPARRYKS